jgi:hypothetical protein
MREVVGVTLSFEYSTSLNNNISGSIIRVHQYTYHATALDWKLCWAQLAMTSWAGETTALVPVGRGVYVGVIKLVG